MLCANDACQGDLGGPLITLKGDGYTPGQNYVLIGERITIQKVLKTLLSDINLFRGFKLGEKMH